MNPHQKNTNFFRLWCATTLSHMYGFFFLEWSDANVCTLWNESLCPSSENMAFVALHLDTSLLGEGGPVMHLKNKQYGEMYTKGS